MADESILLPAWHRRKRPFGRSQTLKGKSLRQLRNRINIVLGARDHRVYIYNSNGLIGGKSMSLKSFIGE